MWFQLELPKAVEVSGIIMDTAGSPHDHPKGCVVEGSTDGKDWGSPLFEGTTHNSTAEISFPPTTAKYLRVKLNADKGGKYWSIHELNVYGRDAK